MDGIRIEVTGNIARVAERPARITSGTVGLPVEFTFDSAWEGLSKTAVFRAGCIQKNEEKLKAETIVPWEVLEKPNVWLSIGVFGVNEDGSVAIPTTWANVCPIHVGVNPDGDPSADPTLPVWQKLLDEVDKLFQSVTGLQDDTAGIHDSIDTAEGDIDSLEVDVGNLELLRTNAKKSLVDAINEAYYTAMTGGVAGAVKVTEVTLLASAWVGDASPYSQVVNIPEITPYSLVDLQPSAEQLDIFHEKDLTFTTDNEGGVVTVYAVGDKPMNDYVIQATIMEVAG